MSSTHFPPRTGVLKNEQSQIQDLRLTSMQRLIGEIAMNPERLVFNDTPAFIPVPEALQHRKVEVILWPLDEDAEIIETPTPTWTDFFKQFSRQVDDSTPCARDELYADRLR
jgi:hypothetical protein